jgi:hypothetical protein
MKSKIFFLILTIVLIFFSILFWKLNLDFSRLNQYIFIIGIFTTIIILSNFFLSIETIEEDQNKKNIEIINDNFIEVEKLFDYNYPFLTKLYSEINPESGIIPVVLPTEQQYENSVKEIHMCNILIKIIETSVDLGIQNELKQTFSNWISSEIFRMNWDKVKNNYKKDTNNFIKNYLKK